MSDVSLVVNGQRFGGWEAVSVTRGIEALVGSFDLTVSERWSGQVEPWEIVEGDECKLYLDDTLVITGFVDKRSLSFSASSHTLSVSGRDKAADLIDSCPQLPRWEFWGQPVGRVVELIAAHYDITVFTDADAGATILRRVVRVNPGDTAARMLDELAKNTGVLLTSDGSGSLVITRPGALRATTGLTLGAGGNILRADASFDQSQRFHDYVVLGQSPWSNEDEAEAGNFVFGRAVDAGARAGRVMLIQGEKELALNDNAKKRAQWEATVRAGRAATLEVTVQGWTQADGELWPVNAKVPVIAPQVGVEGEMLITQARYQLSNTGGTVTTLSLKRPDAFTPEPVAASEVWKLD